MSNKLEETEEPMASASEVTSPRKRTARKFFNNLLTVVGVALFASGVYLLAVYLIPKDVVPDPLKPLVESTQTVVDSGIDMAKNAPEILSSDNIQITVSRAGGDYEVDICDGTFTQYLPYEEAGIQPSLLAHNGCGGSVALYAEMGKIFEISYPDGTTRFYKLVDERQVMQHGTKVSDIADLKGDILIQTCYFDHLTMRVLGLQEVNADGSPIVVETPVEPTEKAPIEDIDLAVPDKKA